MSPWYTVFYDDWIGSTCTFFFWKGIIFLSALCVFYRLFYRVPYFRYIYLEFVYVEFSIYVSSILILLCVCILLLRSIVIILLYSKLWPRPKYFAHTNYICYVIYTSQTQTTGLNMGSLGQGCESTPICYDEVTLQSQRQK